MLNCRIFFLQGNTGQVTDESSQSQFKGLEAEDARSTSSQIGHCPTKWTLWIVLIPSTTSLNVINGTIVRALNAATFSSTQNCWIKCGSSASTIHKNVCSSAE